MLGLCDLTGCRRQALLEYFGESLRQPCGNCDNCLSPPATWDATEATRKALSLRLPDESTFRVNYLINVLTGNSDERIERNRHQQLSTSVSARAECNRVAGGVQAADLTGSSRHGPGGSRRTAAYAKVPPRCQR